MADCNEANVSAQQDSESNTQVSVVRQSVEVKSEDKKRALLVSQIHQGILNTNESYDSTVRSLLYNILCSNDLQLVIKLFKQMQREEDEDDDHILRDVLVVLPEVYEEIKLKNIFLTKKLEFFIENMLISLNFFNENNCVKQQAAQTSLVDINNRIQIVIKFSKELTDKYLFDDKPIDQEFFLTARFLCQNIHILKRQLQSTYNQLPWEEMEFCLVSFVSMHIKCLEFNFAYKLVLRKENILKHVGNFAKVLSELQLSESDVNSKFPKQAYRELSARDSAMKSVITGCAMFEGLYNDFQPIKNVYSLKRIQSYITLVLLIDLEEEEETGKLVIERTLQVIGESLKNTLESPNISDEIHKMLLNSAPRNVRENVTLLRDSLSHAHTLRKKVELEDCKNVEFFRKVQNDLRKINTELSIILYKTKVDMITKFLKSVVDCENEVEMKSLMNLSFNDKELGEMEMKIGQVKEFEDIRKWCNELNDLIKDQTESEKHMLVEVEKILQLQETRLKDAESDYLTELTYLDDFRDMLFENDLEVVKNRARSHLIMIQSKIPPQMLEKVVDLLNDLEKSCKSSGQYKFTELRAIDTLIVKIRYTVLFGAVRIKSIDKFKDSLEKKESDPLLRAKCKINRIIHDIIVNITSIEDRVAIQQEVASQKQCYEAKLQLSINNKQKNTRSSYQTLLNSVKNTIDQDFYDLSITFREFFKSFKNKGLRNKVNAAIDNMLQENEENRQKHFKNRFKMLNRLLSTSNVNGFGIVDEYVEDRTFQAAIEMLVLDLMEVLNEKSLLADNRLYFDGYSPILMGKSLRNYLAHGDALVDILPFDPALAIVSNALKLVQEEKQLLGSAKKYTFTIDRQIGNNFDDLKVHFDCNMKVVTNQDEMFSAATNGNVTKIEDCIHKGADIKARDCKGWTCLHFAVHGNSLDSVKFFLGKNLDIDRNVKDLYGQTPLHTAAISKSSNVIRYLTEECKLNVNDLDLRNSTPLHYCARNGSLDSVEALLEQAANVDVTNDNVVTPLHLSASGGHKDIVKALLDRNANVLAKTKNGLTPFHAAAMHGNKDVVDLLLPRTNDVDIPSKNNVTPLHYAACNGHKAVVEVLLANNANINPLNTDHLTPLHLASHNGSVDVVLFLLEKGAKVNVFTKNFKWTPLHYAAQGGHAGIITLLLKYGVKVDSRTEVNCTALHLAAQNGHYKAINALLDGLANVNTKGSNGWTPLHFAAMNGGTSALKALLIKESNLEAQCEQSRTPLHLATLMGHRDAVEALLEAGGNMYAEDNNSMTPLHYLAAYGHGDILDMTLDKIDEVDVTDDTGQTPLHLAAGQGYESVVNVLLKHGADPNAQTKGNWTPLHFSAGNGRKSVVGILLLNKARVDALTEHNVTPLHLAAMKDKSIVQALLKQGAYIDSLNQYLRTPLHCAAFSGNKEIVEALLAENADVNLMDGDRMTPLHIAAEKGYKDVVEVLIKKGADLEVSCMTDMTALQLAAFCEHANVVEALLDGQRASNVNAQSSNSQWTALHWAAQAGSAEATEALLLRRADPNIGDSNLYTPLHLAISCGHADVVTNLLKGPVSLDSRNSLGWTPLHYATFIKQANTVCSLLNNGASVEVYDKWSNTPLHYAAKSGQIDIVSALLDKNAAVDAQDKNSSTPLLYAAKSGHFLVVRALLDKGAEVNARNTNNETALDFAASNGHVDVVRALLERGADILVQNDNDTVLHQAVESKSEEVVQVIIEKIKESVNNDSQAICQYVNARDCNGNTPMMSAVLEGSASIAKLLVECGANINITNNFGMTALYLATYIGHLELVRLLVNKEANTDIKCHLGKTPLDLAKEKGYSEIVMLLEPRRTSVSWGSLKSYWLEFVYFIFCCNIIHKQKTQ